MRTWNIDTAFPYPVKIGSGLLTQTGAILSCMTAPCKAMVVSDDRVAPLYLKCVEKSLRQQGFSTHSFIFPNGEVAKNLRTYEKIQTALSELHFSRGDLLLSLGGGVAGDLTGFCAATYRRGMRYAQIPTTLLAAVDASVGGKTAIDLPGGKNLIGAFYSPMLVLCDPDVFSSLDKKQLACGFAEVIKCGMICDAGLLSRLEEKSIATEEIVSCCVKIKKTFVEADEYDTGVRRLLNFGHTLGHAMEAGSGYLLSHGEAVAKGMYLMAKAAEENGYAEEPVSKRLKALLEQYGLSAEPEANAGGWMDYIQNDKKTEQETMTVVFPKSWGQCRLETVSVNRFLKIVKKTLKGIEQNE